MIYSGEEGHTLGANYHFLGINEHFGGPSVHCGQILQKNPGKGQSPPFLAMPGFWVHVVPQPLPNWESKSVGELFGFQILIWIASKTFYLLMHQQ